jgi:1,2-dihydroxy-3-keto-5-methylthiopentene dioxygenase
LAHVIVLSDNNRRLEDQEALHFLKDHNIGYEHWDTSGVPHELKTFRKLTEDEQSRLLSVWGQQLERLMESNNYTTADVLCISDSTIPNLDATLDRFRPEHYHTEDEVRFVVSGSGMFGIAQKDPDVRFEVHVIEGDLLKVPQGTWHWFDLEADRRIQAIRLFQDTTGWAPHYRPEHASHQH